MNHNRRRKASIPLLSSCKVTSRKHEKGSLLAGSADPLLSTENGARQRLGITTQLKEVFNCLHKFSTEFSMFATVSFPVLLVFLVRKSGLSGNAFQVPRYRWIWRGPRHEFGAMRCKRSAKQSCTRTPQCLILLRLRV